jgi:hypothetical protein
MPVVDLSLCCGPNVGQAHALENGRDSSHCKKKSVKAQFVAKDLTESADQVLVALFSRRL